MVHSPCGNFVFRIHQAGHSLYSPVRTYRKTKVISPRLVKPHTSFPIRLHTVDVWGNATADLEGLEARISFAKVRGEPEWYQTLSLPDQG